MFVGAARKENQPKSSRSARENGGPWGRTTGLGNELVHFQIGLFVTNVCHQLFTIWATCFPPKWLVAQTVKNLPAMQETGIRSLGRDDPVEKGMGTDSNILAWRIPWIEEPGRLLSMGLQRVRHGWVTNTHSEFTQLPEKYYVICQVFHLLFAFVLWEFTLFPSYLILRKLFNLIVLHSIMGKIL